MLIAGPTASGKSAAARAMAEAAAARGRGAWIVNADAIQVYDALRILTARPDAADEALVPHRLYGHVPAHMRYSVGTWLADVEAVLAAAAAAGVLPVVVGGTGLYFKALTEGLAATPAIPAAVRARWIGRLKAEGAAALYAELRERDAAAADSIRPSDTQRLLRALEVLDATGRSISEWRRARNSPPLLAGDSIVRLIIEPDRAALYRQIEQRFDYMVARGALEEVQSLLRQGLDADLPAMKAIGVRELAGFLRAEETLAQALARAKMQTRRFAKRQMTWMRHQMPGWTRIPT